MKNYVFIAVGLLLGTRLFAGGETDIDWQRVLKAELAREYTRGCPLATLPLSVEGGYVSHLVPAAVGRIFEETDQCELKKYLEFLRHDPKAIQVIDSWLDALRVALQAGHGSPATVKLADENCECLSYKESIELLKPDKGPNQALLPTSTAVTSPAGQEPRQP